MLTAFLILIAGVGVFLVIVAMQPAEFRLQRSATLNASPAAVFAEVNDFHRWAAWSPWAKLDPNCKFTFDGAESGVGAGYAWEGNNKVGKGHMRITDSRPAQQVTLDLHFLKPFPANNTAEFTFAPRENQTLVTWSMSGKKNFMQKAFLMFVSMDKMVGRDFERGLASLKSVAEHVSVK